MKFAKLISRLRTKRELENHPRILLTSINKLARKARKNK